MLLVSDVPVCCAVVVLICIVSLLSSGKYYIADVAPCIEFISYIFGVVYFKMQIINNICINIITIHIMSYN